MSTKAIAYLRTSSLTNSGPGKDSAKRQRAAIAAFAKRAGYSIAAEYADEGVSGADPIEARPGMTAALELIAGNGVTTIIVENASRFARDLMTQEIGFRRLTDLGIALIAADSPSSFLNDGPASKLIRQVLGAVAEFDKASLVIKLRGARERKARETGKPCGGRKPLAELRPETVALAKSLAAYDKVSGTRRSLRKVAAALAVDGHLTSSGTPYAPAAVQRMLASHARRRTPL
jgi:DNA invertase Pin-like site-specific DNA recombinase